MRKEMIEPAGRTKTSARSKKSTLQTSRARAKAPGASAAKAAAPKRRASGTRAGGKAATGSAEATTDHDTIRQWAESRGGKPVSVKGTARSRQHAGLLRIDFPGFSGAGTLEPVSWEEWFQKFDESKLAFLYQDKTKDGKQSRFFKLVKR